VVDGMVSHYEATPGRELLALAENNRFQLSYFMEIREALKTGMENCATPTFTHYNIGTQSFCCCTLLGKERGVVGGGWGGGLVYAHPEEQL